MDASRSHPSAAGRPPALAALALLLGGVLLCILVFDWLDRPPTWNRCAPPSSPELAELGARRDAFLLVAVPLVAAYAVLLASRAWRWAADRRARQGHERRPGRLARAATVVLGSVWLLLVGNAFIADEVGAAILYGYLLAVAGAVLSAALAIVSVLAGVLRDRARPRFEDAIDSLSVGLTWSILLVAVPYLLVAVGVAGKDGTVWC